MDSKTAKSSPSRPDEGSDVGSPPSIVSEKEISQQDSSSMLSTSAISSWARSLKIPQMQQDSQTTNAKNFTLSRLASGLGLQIPSKASVSTDSADNSSASAQSGVIGSITKGIVDSSLNAVKAVQVKARHIVSQNKRRYQVAKLLFYVLKLKKKSGNSFKFVVTSIFSDHQSIAMLSFLLHSFRYASASISILPVANFVDVRYTCI